MLGPRAGRRSLPEVLPKQRRASWRPAGDPSTAYAAAAAAGVAVSASLMRGLTPMQRSTATSSAPLEVRAVDEVSVGAGYRVNKHRVGCRVSVKLVKFRVSMWMNCWSSVFERLPLQDRGYEFVPVLSSDRRTHSQPGLRVLLPRTAPSAWLLELQRRGPDVAPSHVASASSAECN